MNFTCCSEVKMQGLLTLSTCSYLSWHKGDPTTGENYGYLLVFHTRTMMFSKVYYDIVYLALSTGPFEGIQHGRIQALNTNSHCQQCTIKYMAKHTYLTSRHTEYYPEFQECQGIKHMRKIPGPFPQFFKQADNVP